MQPAAQPPTTDLLSKLIIAAAGQQVTPRPSSLVTALERGYQRAWPVVIARLVATALPFPENAATAAISVAAAASWPYLLNLLALFWLPEVAYQDLTRNLFGLTGVPICMAMLALAWWLWRRAVAFADQLSTMVVSAGDRALMTAWLNSRLSFWKQLGASAIGLIVSVVLLTGVRNTAVIPPHPALLYLLVGWLGFTGGGVLYWLLTVAEVPFRLLRCRELSMSWLDPAHTPAIKDACRLYALVAAGMALGVIASEVAAAVLAGVLRSPVASAFLTVFPVLAVLLALYVAVQPYATLSRLVRRHVDTIILGPMLPQTARPDSDLLAAPGFEDATKTYQYFRSLKSLPIRTGWILQYVAGIVTSLVIFLAQKHLS
ncbi:hypothetical protein ACBJ59_24390 [Nonomuraea sp. MTCD27]|uniref:hypothetical protein n=1 Tax=Nonomuraea sp. MTCD27 TaxID=1676747 RepID=UPI0035C13459